jgi:maltose/moltooligosaccharide transporter
LAAKIWRSRKPYFLLGHFYVASLYLSLSVVRYGWQQVCWVLDAEIIPRWNLIEHLLQTLKPAQQPTGFQAQSFFTGFETLANVSLFLFR